MSRSAILGSPSPAILEKKADEIIAGVRSWVVFVPGCCFLAYTPATSFARTPQPRGRRGGGQADSGFVAFY